MQENVHKNRSIQIFFAVIFLVIFFFIYFESSEPYVDPSLTETGTKLNVSSNFLVETYNGNFVERKCKKKSENYFCIRFRTLRIFLDRKFYLVTFERGAGGGGWLVCVSFSRNSHIEYCKRNHNAKSYKLQFNMKIN